MTNKELSKHNDRLRKDSGSIRDERKLVAFLYELMRDHVVPGQIEGLLYKLDFKEEKGKEVLYTNGWLAKYAQDVAARLIR